MVLEHLLRGPEGCIGNGADAGRGTFHHRCTERERFNRDEDISDTVY